MLFSAATTTTTFIDADRQSMWNAVVGERWHTASHWFRLCSPVFSDSNNWTYFPKTWTDWTSGMVAKVGIIIWDELIVALTFACGRLMRAVVCSLPHVVHEDGLFILRKNLPPRWRRQTEPRHHIVKFFCPSLVAQLRVVGFELCGGATSGRHLAKPMFGDDMNNTHVANIADLDVK